MFGAKRDPPAEFLCTLVVGREDGPEKGARIPLRLTEVNASADVLFTDRK
ncbi:MAG: hypothetical protein ABEL51_00725 [Salinibacter sp.]